MWTAGGVSNNLLCCSQHPLTYRKPTQAHPSPPKPNLCTATAQVLDQIEKYLCVDDTGLPQLWHAASKGGSIVKATLAKGAMWHRGRRCHKLSPRGILYTVEAAVAASLIERWVCVHNTSVAVSPWWSTAAKRKARGFDPSHYKVEVDQLALADVGVQNGSVLSLIVDRRVANPPNLQPPAAAVAQAPVVLSLTVLVLKRTRGTSRQVSVTSLEVNISNRATVLELKQQLAECVGRSSTSGISFVVDAHMGQKMPYARTVLVYDAHQRTLYEAQLDDPNVQLKIATAMADDLAPLVGGAIEAGFSLAVEGPTGFAFVERLMQTREQWLPLIPEMDRCLLALQEKWPSLKERWKEHPTRERNLLITVMVNQGIELEHWSEVVKSASPFMCRMLLPVASHPFYSPHLSICAIDRHSACTFCRSQHPSSSKTRSRCVIAWWTSSRSAHCRAHWSSSAPSSTFPFRRPYLLICASRAQSNANRPPHGARSLLCWASPSRQRSRVCSKS